LGEFPAGAHHFGTKSKFSRVDARVRGGLHASATQPGAWQAGRLLLALLLQVAAVENVGQVLAG
jgi:hypothetical protein